VDAASDRGNQPTAIDARTGTVLLAEALDGLSYEDLKPHIERLRKLFGTPSAWSQTTTRPSSKP